MTEEPFIYDEITQKILEHGTEVQDPVQRLNQLAESRKHHKKQRNKLAQENQLLWSIFDGMIAYIKLFHDEL